jgi:hypothetical protein
MLPHACNEQPDEIPDADQGGLLCYGTGAIAAALGIREGQADALIRSGRLPVFRLGKRPAISKRTLAAWIAEQEALADVR